MAGSKSGKASSGDKVSILTRAPKALETRGDGGGVPTIESSASAGMSLDLVRAAL